VLIFFIAGLLYLLRFKRVDNLGAYRIPPETGILIPSDLYKGMSRTFFSLHWGRGMVCAIQPSRHWKTLVWCRALGLDFGCSISAVASSLVATTPISFETEQALRLYGVNHGSI
jgi:hypothetical protein